MSYLRAHIRHLIGVPLCSLALVAPAAAVVDGSYNMMINITPVTAGGSGSQSDLGSDGNWNSFFSIGSTFPNPSYQHAKGMTDNGACVTGGDSVCRGSGIAGDGYAGAISLSINAGAISVSAFSIDTIFDTAAGDWAQYAPDFSAMAGTVDAGGNMLFTPTGRYSAASAPSTLYDRAWNIDDVDCVSTGCVSNGNTAWNHFTTGTHTGAPTGNITGSAFVSLGDVNGDGLADYNGVLVSAGHIGGAFGAFRGAEYFEAWNVTLLSQVPVPAAAWFLGSGLLGIMGMGYRRKQGR